ncbi:MAG TPA: hypothetical protein VF516_11255 [Kofleriaceae bacterium]
MMRISLAFLALGMLALPGCPDPEPTGNPTTLWLSSIGNDETHVQLVATQPPPF